MPFHSFALPMLQVWNMTSHRPEQLARLEGHGSSVSSLAWSPADARLLASGDKANYTVTVWCPGCAPAERVVATLRDDSSADTRIASAAAAGSVDSLIWSPDGAFLAWSSLQAGREIPLDVMVWRSGGGAGSGSGLLRLTGHAACITYMVWAPDGSNRLAAADEEKTVYVWAPDTGRAQPVLLLDTGHTDYVWDMDWSPDGSILVTASWDGTVTLHRLLAGGQVAREVMMPCHVPRRGLAAHAPVLL